MGRTKIKGGSFNGSRGKTSCEEGSIGPPLSFCACYRSNDTFFRHSFAVQATIFLPISLRNCIPGQLIRETVWYARSIA